MSLKKIMLTKNYTLFCFTKIYFQICCSRFYSEVIRFLCKFEKNVLYNAYIDPIQEKASALQLHTKSIKNDIEN